MKIYDSNLTGASPAEAARTQESQKLDRKGPGQSPLQGGVNSPDRVEFSGALGRLSKALSSFGQDRASRVQSLAAQYQSGKYQPDSLATSRAMISHALDVEGKAARTE